MREACTEGFAYPRALMRSVVSASLDGRSLRRRVVTSLAMVLTALACAFPLSGARAQRGYGFVDLEAAMLQKIASFVRWPESCGLQKPSGQFVVTVLGGSPLVPRLGFLYAKPGKGMPSVQVRVVSQRSEIGKTHILFVTRAFSEELHQVLDLVGDDPVLVMGDTPGFAARGVAVNLYRDGDRVRFEINRRALESRGLKASYQLLSLARLVEGL